MDKNKPIETRVEMIRRILETLSIGTIEKGLGIKTGWAANWPKLLEEAPTEKLIKLRSLIGDITINPS